LPIKNTVRVRTGERGNKAISEIGTLFSTNIPLKGSLGIPKEASFWREDEFALHQSIAQPNLGGQAAVKLEVIPKLWRGRLPWDTQRAHIVTRNCPNLV